jgi:hypothetical protein
MREPLRPAADPTAAGAADGPPTTPRQEAGHEGSAARPHRGRGVRGRHAHRGKVGHLEAFSSPPTFPLADDQIALVGNIDGGDSEEFLTIGSLLAHCADALGMDTGSEEGPDEPEALASKILEAIGLRPGEWLDTDSRTMIADRLLLALEADSVADPDEAAGALATALNLEQPHGERLIEALLEVAMTPSRDLPSGSGTSAARR